MPGIGIGIAEAPALSLPGARGGCGVTANTLPRPRTAVGGRCPRGAGVPQRLSTLRCRLRLSPRRELRSRARRGCLVLAGGLWGIRWTRRRSGLLRQAATAETQTTQAQPGVASFWTLLYFGEERGVVALRDVVEQQSDGHLTFVGLGLNDRPPQEAMGGRRPAAAKTKTKTKSGSVDAEEEPSGLPLQQPRRSWYQRALRWLRPTRKAEDSKPSPAVDDDVIEPPTGDDETISFFEKRTSVQPGEGFGQFCKLTSKATHRLLTRYRQTARVSGQANTQGVCMADVEDTTQYLEPLLGPEFSAGGRFQIIADEEILAFKDVASMRMPLGVENNFKIHICPMKPERELQRLVADHEIKPMRSLLFGLPDPCDVFREAAFTGQHHGLGIVPAISEQQFIMGSAHQGRGYTWVRFDKRDLRSYDHDLRGMPMLEDKDGIFFPVTHLWVDFDFPTAAYALEWFCGTRCLVRRELSLWPMPHFLVQKIIGLTLGFLRDVR